MEKGTTRQGRGLRREATVALAALFLGAITISACGNVDLAKLGKGEKEPGADKPKAAAVAGASGSSCVSCHTDKEKLKMETAGIKAPKGSALTSGKG